MLKEDSSLLPLYYDYFFFENKVIYIKYVLVTHNTVPIFRIMVVKEFIHCVWNLMGIYL